MIQGTENADTGLIEHMRVDHSGRHIGMAQQGLHGTDIIIGLQQMGGKAVPQGMTPHPFVDLGSTSCPLHRLLNRSFMQVVAAYRPAVGIDGETARRKKKLPFELPARIRVLACHCTGQNDLPITRTAKSSVCNRSTSRICC